MGREQHLLWAHAGMAMAPSQWDPSPAPGLTVNTRDGTGVSSRGWIMDRMEGRCPSRDPTKNSLGGDTERGTQCSHSPAGLCAQHTASGASPSSALVAPRQGWNSRTGTPALELQSLTHQGGWTWPGNAGRMDLYPALQGQPLSDSSGKPGMCQSRNHLSPAPAQPFSPSQGILIPEVSQLSAFH